MGRNISYCGPDLMTLHTVNFGVLVTSAVFFMDSQSVFYLFFMLKINVFRFIRHVFFIWG
jgi:hypothetical protein